MVRRWSDTTSGGTTVAHGRHQICTTRWDDGRHIRWLVQPQVARRMERQMDLVRPQVARRMERQMDRPSGVRRMGVRWIRYNLRWHDRRSSDGTGTTSGGTTDGTSDGSGTTSGGTTDGTSDGTGTTTGGTTDGSSRWNRHDVRWHDGWSVDGSGTTSGGTTDGA